MSTERHTVILRTLSFIFNAQGEVLLLERASDKFDAGMFNGLGGHIEEGEDIIAAANREILEESGIVPDKTQLAGIMHVTNLFGKNILMFATKSTSINPELKESMEGKLQWVKIVDLANYKVYADIKPFLERIAVTDQKFIGTSVFDGKGELLSLNINDME